MAPSGWNLTLVHSRLHISNSRGLTTGCVSLCVLFLLQLISVLLHPYFRSPSLRRFDIITAVMQSKTVKVKLPPSLPMPVCLFALVFALPLLCWKYITENKSKIYNYKKPVCSSVGSWYVHSSSVWHFARQKSTECTCRTWTIIFFLRSASFCSWAEPQKASPLQQSSTVANRSEACGCKRQVWTNLAECEFSYSF